MVCHIRSDIEFSAGGIMMAFKTLGILKHFLTEDAFSLFQVQPGILAHQVIPVAKRRGNCCLYLKLLKVKINIVSIYKM